MDNWGQLKIEILRTPLTYVYLANVARESLKQNTAAGAMAASVFAAFAAEAYFNHVGQERIEYWEKASLESLRPQAKAVLLNNLLLGVSVDWSTPRYQTLAEAISYRNALAHGKTETTKALTTLAGASDDLWSSGRLVKWERCQDLAVAKRLVEGVEQLIERMQSALGNSGSPFDALRLGEPRAKP